MTHLINKDANIIKCCGIEFPQFGANYPDARCIDGYLWDMDSGEATEDGIDYFCFVNQI